VPDVSVDFLHAFSLTDRAVPLLTVFCLLFMSPARTLYIRRTYAFEGKPYYPSATDVAVLLSWIDYGLICVGCPMHFYFL